MTAVNGASSSRECWRGGVELAVAVLDRAGDQPDRVGRQAADLQLGQHLGRGGGGQARAARRSAAAGSRRAARSGPCRPAVGLGRRLVAGGRRGGAGSGRSARTRPADPGRAAGRRCRRRCPGRARLRPPGSRTAPGSARRAAGDSSRASSGRAARGQGVRDGGGAGGDGLELSRTSRCRVAAAARRSAPAAPRRASGSGFGLLDRAQQPGARSRAGSGSAVQARSS